MGMSFLSNGCRPFTLIPRQSSLAVLAKVGVNKTYDSLAHILSMHHISLSRGHTKTIFGDCDDRVMYKCLGVHPSRNSKGVLDCNRWAESIDAIHWCRVMKMVARAELLFESFAQQEAIDHLHAAKDVVGFKTMHAPHGLLRNRMRIPYAKYFGAVAFGRNVFLHCHTDDDFSYSNAHVLLGDRTSYQLDDSVVVYF